MVDEKDIPSDDTEKNSMMKARICARMYRAHTANETVLRKAVLAGLVTTSPRGRVIAEELIEEMVDEKTCPLRNAVGGGSVELALQQQHDELEDWVASYVAEKDPDDSVQGPGDS